MTSLSDMHRRQREIYRRGPQNVGVRYMGHKEYRWFTLRMFQWFSAFITRRLTPVGAIVFLLSLMTSELVLSMGERAATYYAPFAILGLFILGWGPSRLLRPKVRMKRRMPSSATVGDEVRLSYDVENTSPLAVRDLSLDLLPLPSGLKYSRGNASIGVIPGHGRASTVAHVRAERRGRYILPTPRADTAFPSFVWRWGCYGEGSR